MADSYRLAADVLLQQAGSEGLLVQLNAENVFALNDTGVHIVQQVTGGLSLDDAIEQLAAAYAGDVAVIGADVRQLVVMLLDRGLLERNG
jgi:hypothetical protein